MSASKREQYVSGALSPSQIDTYVSCNRKWGFSSLAKLPQPKKGPTEAGTRGHEILEEYLRDGKEIDRHEVFDFEGKTFNVGAAATAMARDLPEKGSVAPELIESHFLIDVDGIKIQGFRDLIRYGHVRDHKFTSALKWAKTPEALGANPQALIYVTSMFAEDMADDSCEFELGYGQILGPAKTKIVRRSFTESEASDLLYEHVMPHAREMIKFHESKKEVSELDVNLDACEKYGGCPFKSQCSRPIRLGKNKGRRTLSVLTKEEMLAKMRAKRAGVVAAIMAKPAPEGTATVTIGSESTTVPIQDLDTAEQIKDKLVAAGVPEEEAIVLRETINPPPCKSFGDEETRDAVVGQTYVDGNPTDSVEADSIPTQGEEVKPEPKRRGRKPKAKQEEVVTYDPEETKQIETSTGFTLYIGCEPIRQQVTYLHDILPAVMRAAEQANGLQHWSFADFGQGKGLLATAIRTALEASPITGALVVKFPHLPETQAVLSELVHLASEVVQ